MITWKVAEFTGAVTMTNASIKVWAARLLVVIAGFICAADARATPVTFDFSGSLSLIIDSLGGRQAGDPRVLGYGSYTYDPAHMAPALSGQAAFDGPGPVESYTPAPGTASLTFTRGATPQGLPPLTQTYDFGEIDVSAKDLLGPPSIDQYQVTTAPFSPGAVKIYLSAPGGTWLTDSSLPASIDFPQFSQVPNSQGTLIWDIGAGGEYFFNLTSLHLDDGSVPEPCLLGLAGVGLLALARRRR
jgi:MYXO-CTERM domain-containing protein